MRALIAVFAFLASALLVTAEEKIPSADPLTVASREMLAGRPEAALAALAVGEKDGALDGKTLSLRGSIRLEQGKFEEAIADFRAAREKDMTMPSPRIHLGDAFLRQKKWEEARAAYAEVLRVTNMIILSERLSYGILLTHLAEKNEAEAKTALERVVFPTESPAYYYAQAAWAFAHDNNKAGVKWLKTADKIFDEKQIAWFARPLYDFGWIKTKPPLVLD